MSEDDFYIVPATDDPGQEWRRQTQAQTAFYADRLRSMRQSMRRSTLAEVLGALFRASHEVISSAAEGKPEPEEKSQRPISGEPEQA